MYQVRETDHNQRIMPPYRLVSRVYHPEDSTIPIKDTLRIGHKRPLVIMAGSCAVESGEDVSLIAEEVREYGAVVLCGGAWKPHIAPRTFEGREREGLDSLVRAGAQYQLPIITEVPESHLVAYIAKYADILQVGTHNMDNSLLLSALGKQPKPVLLKRSSTASIDQFLSAAEHIIYAGNPHVILCLQGITTFDQDYHRYLADLDAIPELREKTHLPIVFDPSHAATKRAYVLPLAQMAIAGGVDGLIIESHYDPTHTPRDGVQTITPREIGVILDYAHHIHRSTAGHT